LEKQEFPVHKSTNPLPAITAPEAEAAPLSWDIELGDLLLRAAILCIEQGLDVETFMRGAWSAYVEARPGMRDQIEEMQLIAQLDELRKAGRLGEA
jgi:hypothetical protein